MARKQPGFIRLIVDRSALVGYLLLCTPDHHPASETDTMPATSVAKGLAKIRTPVPLFLRWRNHWYSARLDQMIEIEHIFGTRGVWKRLAKAHEIEPSEWRLRSIGPFLCGYKLDPALERIS